MKQIWKDCMSADQKKSVVEVAEQGATPKRKAYGYSVGVIVLHALLLLVTLSGQAQAALPANQAIFQSEQTDLVLKVKNGEIVIRHGYFEGAWYPNLNWVPISVTYDNFDNSLKSVRRSHTDYDRVAAGVFQDQYNNIIRQTADGYRWNDPRGNWIEYNIAGEVVRYGNRNGVTASFQYSGSAVLDNNGTPLSAGRLTGVLDAVGNQAIWFDYTGNDITRVRDRANRSVLYPRDADHQLSGYTDAQGNTWKYSIAVEQRSVTYKDPDGNTKTYITTYIRYLQTDPEGRTTTRLLNNNGTPVSITRPDGTSSSISLDFDKA